MSTFTERRLGMVTAAFYVAVTLSYHSLDVWARCFSTPGPDYLAASILKLVFLPCYLLVLIGLGRLFLPDRLLTNLGPDWTRLDVLVMRGLFGAGAMLCNIFILGFADLYRFWILLAATAPLAYLGAPTLADIWRTCLAQLREVRIQHLQTWVMALLLTMTIAGVADMYIRNVNVPTGYFDGDVLFSYFPFYRELAEATHSWWPSTFHQFFYSKGSGLQILAVVLLDPMAASLGSFALLLLSFAALYSMARRLTGQPALSSLALVLYAMSRMTHNLTFYKPHIGLAAWIILWMAYLSLLWRTPQQSRPVLLWGGVLAIAGLAIFQPTHAFLALTLVIWACLGAALSRERFSALVPLTTGGAALLGAGGIFAVNRFTTGIWDISFLSISRHVDLARLSRWMAPEYLSMLTVIGSSPEGPDGAINTNVLTLDMFRRALNKLNTDTASYWGWLVPDELHWLFFLAVLAFIALLALRSLRRDGAPRQELWMLLGGEGLCLAAYLIIQHAAITRALFFASGLTALAVATLAGAFASLGAGSRVRRLSCLLALLLVMGAPGMLRDIAFWDWNHYLKPFTGEWAYERFQEYNYPTSWYVDTQKRMPPYARCLVLNSKNGALTIPESRFDLSLYNSFMPLLGKVLYGSPEMSRITLLEHGDLFAAVDLNAPLDLIALSPTFAPDAISAYWSTAWSEGDKWVLTWREPGQPPLPEVFLARYREQYGKMDGRSLALFEAGTRGVDSQSLGRNCLN